MEVSIVEAANFLTFPFLMCVLLAGIHCYLGLHVLARGVIFIDLSLAQIAALGSTVGIAVGFHHDSSIIYFISLGCTFVAAAVFSYARKFEKFFSQEAIIGIVYAFGSAAVILVIDRISHGTEHIKDLLIGKVLWVTESDVIKTALIYMAVGLVHYIFRKQFLNVSYGKSQKNAGFWDFLFYCLFGVVITSSVRIAGVLQVFSYLIVPAFISLIFFKTTSSRLIFGWILGVVLSFLGISLSYLWNLPSGAFIVVCFTSVPLLTVMLFPILKKYIS